MAQPVPTNSRGAGDPVTGGDRSEGVHEEEHLAEPASSSAQTLQPPSLKESPGASSASEESCVAATSSSILHSEAVALAPGSPILSRLPRDWGLQFYIRVDLSGSFHTYPRLDGPFKSLQEADDAIDRHLRHRRLTKMCPEQGSVSRLDKVVQQCLYWPDGRRKKRSKSHVVEQSHNRMCLLAKALVDKHNENRNLFGDLAHELKDVVQYQSVCENRVWYYHLNIMTRAEGADGFSHGIDNLFFAEVKRVRQGQQEELVVSCFCMLKPTDNGCCYGCTNNGSPDMKHPSSTDKYTAGHLNAYLPFGCRTEFSDSDDEEEAEAKLRDMYEGLDEPDFLEKLFTFPTYVTLRKDRKGT
ncbi:uncharacterized protein LOC123428426 [Hordeum vulgare subsp. vulgare]|uniref:Predicted protein n=1 Tax=Hordeum vulgare subsp. vulgare TaxID=112509 RepID=F2EDS4_HORVV|nr:uncharacterized protein LOC123428426 [Hordeum vulgare subsp. vulgare]BAK05496.1 predicted protein [Hordeum vulgare subsp. vulgare]